MNSGIASLETRATTAESNFNTLVENLTNGVISRNVLAIENLMALDLTVYDVFSPEDILKFQLN